MSEWNTLARPYAKAAFDFGFEQNALGDWSRQLATLAAVVETEKVQLLISSATLSTDQQAQVLADLMGDELSAPVRNFLEVLAENKRLRLLPTISALFEQLKAYQEKSVKVEVISAFPLENDLSDRLAQALRDKWQREVSISTEVDKRLLGGVVIRAGDMVIDGSVRGRLAKLAKAMNS